MSRIGVIGSRGYNQYEEFKEKLLFLISNIEDEIIFISGGCKSGSDALIARFCKEEDYPIVEYLPNWDLHGKAAGFIRNKLIIEDSDLLAAWWDGKSKGTQSSLDLAAKKGIKVKIIKI